MQHTNGRYVAKFSRAHKYTLSGMIFSSLRWIICIPIESSCASTHSLNKCVPRTNRVLFFYLPTTPHESFLPVRGQFERVYCCASSPAVNGNNCGYDRERRVVTIGIEEVASPQAMLLLPLLLCREKKTMETGRT